MESSRRAAVTMSTHVIPSHFPFKAEMIQYPHVENNPLYSTTNGTIGSEMPQDYHLPEVYFPKSNRFSQSFAGREKRYEGLVTNKSFSKIHSSFDQSY